MNNKKSNNDEDDNNMNYNDDKNNNKYAKVIHNIEQLLEKNMHNTNLFSPASHVIRIFNYVIMQHL